MARVNTAVVARILETRRVRGDGIRDARYQQKGAPARLVRQTKRVSRLPAPEQARSHKQQSLQPVYRLLLRRWRSRSLTDLRALFMDTEIESR